MQIPRASVRRRGRNHSPRGRCYEVGFVSKLQYFDTFSRAPRVTWADSGPGGRGGRAVKVSGPSSPLAGDAGPAGNAARPPARRAAVEVSRRGSGTCHLRRVRAPRGRSGVRAGVGPLRSVPSRFCRSLARLSLFNLRLKK